MLQSRQSQQTPVQPASQHQQGHAKVTPVSVRWSSLSVTHRTSRHPSTHTWSFPIKAFRSDFPGHFREVFCWKSYADLRATGTGGLLQRSTYRVAALGETRQVLPMHGGNRHKTRRSTNGAIHTHPATSRVPWLKVAHHRRVRQVSDPDPDPMA
jgi:hypothetical protein